MANDTITLELTGDQVPFDEFERAIAGWKVVIDTLTAESAAKIEWVIQELHGGSLAARSFLRLRRNGAPVREPPETE